MYYFGLLPPTVPTCYLVHQHLSDTIVLPSTTAAFEDEDAFTCCNSAVWMLAARPSLWKMAPFLPKKLPKWMHETVLLSAE